MYKKEFEMERFRPKESLNRDNISNITKKGREWGNIKRENITSNKGL